MTGAGTSRSDSIEVSVIIPVRDATTTLPAQLEALAAQACSACWEVVIADNGSTDGTPDLAKRWMDRFPKLRVIDASAGTGAAHARNEGAEVADGDLLVFCDADDVVGPGWLKAIVEACFKWDLVGGALDHEALNDVGNDGWRGGIATGALPTTFGFLPFAASGNFAIRAEAFRAVGGWNGRYLAGEDMELCWRAQLAGFRLGFAPDAVVGYRARKDVSAAARQSYTVGRSTAALFRDFRAAGMKRTRAWKIVRLWVWAIVTAVPYLASSRRHRLTWVRRTLEAAGRIHGSLEQRVFFL